ncbi:MAG: hypothetical protein KH009_06665 [Clostridiales bacterium]|nr:hypothetical protein [Clostridiales bacterium]
MDHTGISMQPARRQTLVLVTDQFRCERIIKARRAISNITHTQLRVLSVSRADHMGDPIALQYLFDIARENGSVLEILYSDDFGETLLRAVAEGNTVNVITGEPGDESSVLYRLWARFPGVKFFTADPEGRLTMVEPVAARA